MWPHTHTSFVCTPIQLPSRSIRTMTIPSMVINALTTVPFTVTCSPIFLLNIGEVTFPSPCFSFPLYTPYSHTFADGQSAIEADDLQCKSSGESRLSSNTLGSQLVHVMPLLKWAIAPIGITWCTSVSCWMIDVLMTTVCQLVRVRQQSHDNCNEKGKAGREGIATAHFIALSCLLFFSGVGFDGVWIAVDSACIRFCFF